jgi:hypothetical protein
MVLEEPSIRKKAGFSGPTQKQMGEIVLRFRKTGGFIWGR